MSDDEEYAKLLEGTILEVPKAKRPRKSAEPAPEPELVTLLKLATSPQFWFPDGNVVVVARDSLAFKVHRGVLARHSAVIDNLLRAAKPPAEKGQSWDGCPVVHIPDSPKDFEWLLMALYDGPKVGRTRGYYAITTSLDQIVDSDCSSTADDSLSNVVAALLELGHKYNIEVIRQESALAHEDLFLPLLRDLPAPSVTFGTVVRGSEGHRYAEMALFTPVLEVIPTQDAIRAVNVIRLVKQTSMLPMALYLCTMIPAATLATGVMRPDGRCDTLSQEDLIRCIDARTTLAMRTCRKRETIWYSRWWRGVDAMCGNSRACREAIAVKMKAEREARTIFPTAHPLASLAPEIRTLSLCAACLEAMLAAEVEETRFVWEKLPADLRLDVPEWNAALTK